MKIYRIYKIVTEYGWSNIYDDYRPVDVDETIKYVDSKEKVNKFFKEIEYKNNTSSKCYKCPILHLTKRKYSNGKHNDVNDYCDKKQLSFSGNRINCANYRFMDLENYSYEEIEVE